MEERARVMLLLSSLHGGGAERVAVHLLNNCDPDLVDVRMGLLRRAGPFLADADASRIDTPAMGEDLLAFEGRNSSFYRPDRLLAGAIFAPAALAGMIKARRPHVVVSFLKGVSVLTGFVVGGMGARRPRWIAREGNNTDAVIDEELANPAARAMIKGLTRRCYRAADCFLANSNEMADGLTRDLGLDSTRVRMIHNPIDIAGVKAKAALAPDGPIPSRPFIVAVGRLEYQKAHDMLLRAFAASRASNDHDLVIVGRGTAEDELRRQACELGLAERVHFVGFTDNPWAWVRRAKLFVLTSRWEGFPTSVAEALACGTPALVTACDFGPAEVVEHGINGWVTPTEDQPAFTAAMDMLLETPQLLERFACEGPRRAANFGLASMVGQYTDLFLEQTALQRQVTGERVRA
ncbi:MAG TPA: glycosyltransferase [Caulobacteraceae bacterium]|nr:glycosyltransferase [Caulobacteraceae bacterium]